MRFVLPLGKAGGVSEQWREIAPGITIRLVSIGTQRLRARDHAVLVMDHWPTGPRDGSKCNICELPFDQHGPFLKGSPRQVFIDGAEIEVRTTSE